MRWTTLAVLTLAVPSLGAAPAIPDLLPSTTLLAAGTPSTTALREGFERTPEWALWQDPEFHGFVEPLVNRVAQALQGPDGQPVLTVDEFFDLFPGQFYLGILRCSAVGGHPDFGPFVAAETPRPERVLEIVDRLVEASGAQQTRDTYSVQGVTVARNTLRFAVPTPLPGEVNPTPETVMAPQEQTVTLHTAVTDGLVIVTIDEPLDALIGNLRGAGTGGLSQSPSLQSTSQMAGSPQHDLLVHLNPAPLQETLNALVTPSSNFNPAALGLSDFRGLTGWVRLGPEARDSWFALSVVPNPVGLGRLLRHGGAGESPALAWVPGDVATFSAFHFDLGGAWSELRQLLRGLSPTFSTTLDGLLMTAGQSLGFDIERDFLTALGRDVVNYTVMAAGADPTSVIIIGLADPARIQDALRRLAQPPAVGTAQVSGTGMLETHEYLGQTYYTPPSPFVQQSPQAPPQPGFAVLGDQLVFAASTTELQRVIAASQGQMGAGVRESPLWERLAPVRMDSAGGLSYADDAAVMASAAERLQQMALFFMMTPQLQIPLDFARLPGREVFERHLTHTVTATRLGPEGLLGHSRTPHRR